MAAHHKAYECWFKFLSKGKYVIILFWIVVLVFGLKIGPQFLKHTKASMNPPPGSLADNADQKFAQTWPSQSGTNKLIVFVQWFGNEPNKSIIDASNYYLNATTHELNATLYTDPDWGNAKGYIQSVYGYWTYPPGTPLAALNTKFICCGPEPTYSIMQILYHPPTGTDLGSMISVIRSKLSDLQKDPFTLGLTGQDALYQDMLDGTGADMARMDIIVLPLALLVLAYVVKSYRLMIIPVLSVACSLFTSFMLMYPIALHVYNVASVAPSVMMSLTIAMSIDYSLFLLTRYREEHGRKRDELTKQKKNELAVKNMEFFAGHIVAVSGCTLAITFVALAFFPMDFLKSVGVGAALALACTMSVNLTLTPAILLSAGGFFSYFDTPWLVRKLCPCFVKKPVGTLQENGATPDGYPIAESASVGGPQGGYVAPRPVGNSTGSGVNMAPLLSGDVIVHSQHSDEDYAKVRRQLNSFWYRSAVFSTTNKFSVAIIAFVLIVAVPFLYELTKMTTTIDTNQLIPRNSDALEIFNVFKTTFPPGQIKPYNVIMDTTNTGVLNQKFWDFSRNFTESMTQRCPGVTPDNINTITNKDLSWALRCLGGDIDPKQNFECALYQVEFSQLVDQSRTVTYVSFVTTFDPTGDDSPTFIEDARNVMDDYSAMAQYGNYTLQMTGGAVDSYDAVAEVHQLFPSMIGGTCAAVFIIVGALFRSLFVPIRLLLTIAIPICWIYGLSVIVFQIGTFDAIFTTLQDYNSIYWLIPVMCFSILVGLGLDYDIFLFSRVVEYRKLGYQDRAAITKGIYRTGGIITAAGVIMFIAFAGLMLSKEMVLNQYGFMLSFAVLVDTFVVRTLLVPAIMQLAGPVNWWPGAMPPATKDAACQDEEEEDLSDDEGEEGEYDQAFENDPSKNLITRGSHQTMTTPSSEGGTLEE